MSFDHPDWWRPIGGQNSQDSILERRSLIWNDNGIEDGAIPGSFYVAPDFRGKFFTRGCRGMLEQIQLYCTGDGADELTIRYSPHPGLGPFGEVTITPAAGWAWQDFDILEMWNYDSLFIWFFEAGPSIDWAYDDEQPHDEHSTGDLGLTWYDQPRRPYLRAMYTGETPGDVPVSGVVNTIALPSVAGEWAHETVLGVLDRIPTDICMIEGAGTLLEARLMFNVIPIPAAAVYWELTLWADGALAYYIMNDQITQSTVAVFGRTGHAEFWQTANTTNMTVRMPLQFTRSLLLRTYQATGAPINVTGRLFVNLLR